MTKRKVPKTLFQRADEGCEFGNKAVCNNHLRVAYLKAFVSKESRSLRECPR